MRLLLGQRKKMSRSPWAGSGLALFLVLISVGLIILVYIHGDEWNLDLTLRQGKIKGHRLASRRGREILAFEGIPYAKPPVGELRFRTSRPLEPWTGQLDATKPGPKCTQINVFRYEKTVSGQEDCLYLNVYTPKISIQHVLDVMVYFHGGGWLADSGSAYRPEYLLDKDVVLVTINYRLGPLGFLSTGDAVCPGNNGLKDQVAALRWVQDNIAFFGGNPGSVTIFGHNSGAASVQFHLLSPMSRGLFHRAISHSGYVLSPGNLDVTTNAVKRTKELASNLNCSIANSIDIINCLRNRSNEEITAVSMDFMEWDIHPLPFLPVIEPQVGEGLETFLSKQPKEMVKRSTALHHVPWMTGITSADGALFTARILSDLELLEDFTMSFNTVAPVIFYYWNSTKQEDISADIYSFYFGNETLSNETVTPITNMFTDRFFFYGASKSIRLHLEAGTAPLYYYYFDHRGSNSYCTLVDPTRNYGVCHGDELLYLFPSEEIFGSSYNETDGHMIDLMTSLWTDFAHTGDPTYDEEVVTWEPASCPNDPEYLHITGPRSLHMKSGLLLNQMSFWDNITEQMYPMK